MTTDTPIADMPPLDARDLGKETRIQATCAPPPTLDELWERLVGEANAAKVDLAVAEARIEGFLLYQNHMPAPEPVPEPPAPTFGSLSEALTYQGGLPGSLPPSAIRETQTCPQCGGSHFFSRSHPGSDTPDPSPMCFTCGWTAKFYQDPEAPVAPVFDEVPVPPTPPARPERPRTRTTRRQRITGRKS